MSMVMVLLRSPARVREVLIADDEAFEALLEPTYDDDRPDDGTVLDLHKAWDGATWLLSGGVSASDPLGEALAGGTEFGEDGGYGPPRLVRADDVERVSLGLAALDEALVRARFDPAAMADVYPGGWDEDGSLDEELLPAVRSVRDFYAGAAAAGDDIVIYLT